MYRPSHLLCHKGCIYRSSAYFFRPSISCCCFIFFFQLSRGPRDLHSFPTRRSSDLWTSSVEVTTGKGTFGGYLTVVVQRSEEHTSELQSHSDLVCRLLLEKKNRN